MMIQRQLKPSSIFLMMLVFFQFIPTLFIVLLDIYTFRWIDHGLLNYQKAALLGLTCITIFTTFVYIGLLTKRTLAKGSSSHLQNSHPTESSMNRADLKLRFLGINVHKLVFFISSLAAFYLWFYFLFLGGMEKLMLTGTDVSALDFRVHGADDRDRINAAILQISRRLVLPFAIVYLYTKRVSLGYRSLKGKGASYQNFLIISLLISSIATLDRAPFLMMLVMFFYLKFIYAKSVVKFSIKLASSFFFIMIFFGVLSYIQHNSYGFTWTNVVDAGIHFFFKRAYLAPSTVPIELSYAIFSEGTEKLMGQHSRLFAIILGNYVGFSSSLDSGSTSLYVSPVGVVADIWRNFGYVGLIFIGFFLGWIFASFDSKVKKNSSFLSSAQVFTSLSLVFYLLYGTLLSQGVFLQFTFLYITTLVSTKPEKKFN